MIYNPALGRAPESCQHPEDAPLIPYKSLSVSCWSWAAWGTASCCWDSLLRGAAQMLSGTSGRSAGAQQLSWELRTSQRHHFHSWMHP